MKRTLILVLMIFSFCISLNSYASFKDIRSGVDYTSSVDRISALGIMNGYGNNLFYPNTYLTREQFAKVIISASNLDDEANVMKGATIFPDVNQDGWSAGFVNLAIKKGFIKGMLDGNFHPSESVTFAQTCTIMVKALSYTEQDVPGLWPFNYVEKAKNLGLAKGLSFEYDASMPRWALAVMIDNLLDCNIKKSAASTPEKTFANFVEISEDIVILGDSKLLSNLAQNQVQTDKGIYYTSNLSPYEVGSKYEVKIEDDKILSFVRKSNTTKGIAIEKAIDSEVFYLENSKSKSLNISGKTSYYYKGEKINYDTIQGILQANTSIIFGNTKDDSGFEYGIIMDPVLSKPAVVTSSIKDTIVGNIDLSKATKILKGGKSILISDIAQKDVIYNVTDVWGNNPYVLIYDTKAQGKITDILPNKISPQTIEIDTVKYKISKDMNIEILTSNNSFKIDDKISALLGYDGKIVDISKYDIKQGPFIEYIILGDSRYNTQLSDKQIKTNNGTYYMGISGQKLEAGNNYELVVDDDTIVRIGEKLQKLAYYTVETLLGSSISYKEGAYLKTLALPQTVTYYYDGSIVTYNTALTHITANSTLAFAWNEQSSGYKYVAIFDPVYSEPEVHEAGNVYGKKVGDIDLSEGYPKIIKNRQLILDTDVKSADVLYEVTDIFGKNRFIEVYANRVTGKINAILPNRISPSSITVGTTNYSIGKEINIADWIWDERKFVEGTTVTIILDKNDVILRMF